MFNGIGDYLESKKKNKFSGLVKITVEGGIPKILTEYNIFENDLPPIPADFSIENEVKTITARNFYGTVGYKYENGEIVAYSLTRVRQGNSLLTYLGL